MKIPSPMKMARDLGVALQSIVRNGRRSMAMLSGIILGTLIISSIVIYTGILQEENYRSIVKGASYEVSVVPNEAAGEDFLWNLAGNLTKDDRINSMSVFGGSTISGLGENDQEVSYVEAVISREQDLYQTERERSSNSVVFARQNFTQTEIFNKMVGNKIEGTFDLWSDPQTNRTVIPRSLASRMNANVGDVLPYVNITITTYGRNDVDMIKYSYTNVTIVGIYDTSSSSATGLLAEFMNTNIIFMDTDLLYRYDNPLLPAFIDKKMFYLAVKITESKFNLEDTTALDGQITTLSNDITRESNDTVAATNLIGALLLPFTILNYFLIFFDYILVLPTIVISIYLLFFGLELSLEERRREIGILKVQGADPAQIFGLLRNESLVLFGIGMVFGYILGMVGAWIISSSDGFLSFSLLKWSGLLDFLTFDLYAFLVPCVAIGFLLFMAVRRKGRDFINMEVLQNVVRFEEKKESFIKRNSIDVILLVFGIAGAAITIIYYVFDYTISFNTFVDIFVMGFLATIALWIGGALSGARVAKRVPLLLEKWFLSMSFLKDVANIARSGLRRRGDVDRLVVIIVLTLSVATVAASQGYTDEQYSIRSLEWEIGGDYMVTYSAPANHTADIASSYGVKEVIPLPTMTVKILSTTTIAYGFGSNWNSAIWHDDAVSGGSGEYESAMADLMTPSDMPEVILGSGLADHTGSSKGSIVSLKVATTDENGTSVMVGVKARVIAIFDHAPGNIDSSALLCNLDFMRTLNDIASNTTMAPGSELPAAKYIVSRASGADGDKTMAGLEALSGVSKVRSLDDEIANIGGQMNFGIPGLLTMMFITSLIASLTCAFAFSAIIMERRKRELAVLQTIGASRWQIYKVAMAENLPIMLTSVVWGILIGLGAAYQMNGLFSFIRMMLGQGTLSRIPQIPWLMVLALGAATLLGMLAATALSARSAARQDLSVATRVI